MRWIAALAICLVAASAWAQPDWGATRDPFDAGTVARYKAILVRDPYDEGALRELVGMYRRYRSVAKLEGEYQARLAANADEWATLVVLARMKSDVPLWRRAVAVKPDDARAWLAIGDAARTDAKAATEAYQKAAQLAATPKVKKAALQKLVAVAREPAAIDAAYGELIAMAPTDGKLWLDRGNAQMAAKQHAAALESFAKAEQTLRTDPERRLVAMTSQGLAHDAMGKSDDAIAQYERALAATPRGHYLANELAMRVVDVERKRKQLDAAVAWVEKRWAEKARGYFEWALLGDLETERGREEPAIAAYRRALAKAPTEVETQRKLIALLDKKSPSEALAQHEKAGKIAPGDAGLQLELAKRYRTANEHAKGMAVLAALGRRMKTNVSVRVQIAELYEEWEELDKAIIEYEAIAKLEPNEPDHAIKLGEAYWRAEKSLRALAAWERLETIGTARALFRYGEVLSMHDVWPEAVGAYTKSLVKDPANADAFYGRARALEALQKFGEAVEDARRAVALTNEASLDDGLRNRNMLVRVLAKEHEVGAGAFGRTLEKWRFAFERGEVGAGYLLAAHHGRTRNEKHHELLVELYRRAPTDDSLGLAVARSYRDKREFAKARAELQRIMVRAPAREKDVLALLEQLDEEQARIERQIRLEEEGRSRSHKPNESPGIVGRNRRFGFRFLLGSDVDEASGALVGFGLYRYHRVASATAWTWRIDWTKRDDDMLEHRTFSAGAALARRLVDARRFELGASAGVDAELRWGNGIPNDTQDRAALGANATVELLPRALPSTLGVRLHHSLTESTSTVFVELGFELR